MNEGPICVLQNLHGGTEEGIEVNNKRYVRVSQTASVV
jgi:hypothetical protein